MALRSFLAVLGSGLAALLSLTASAQPEDSAVDADSSAAGPKWEAGLLAGGGRIADYPGADESHSRGLLVPVLIYRGPILRVDQGGIRGRLVNTSDFEFDISASAAFNARDNQAREGMPELDYLFGIGPQLIYKGLRGLPGSPSLHLKVRAVSSTDFHRIDGRGFVVDPEVRWRFRPVAGWPGNLSVSLQPTWASGKLMRYFYEVEPGQATPNRRAYEARAGYLGTELSLGLNQRLSPRLSWFAGVRALSLHGAANADSPLLRRDSNFSVTAGLLWTPWQSEARAAD